MKYSIVIPCYNEEDNIPLLIKEFDRFCEEYEIQIILVNNGSEDNTAKILDEYCPIRSYIKVVNVNINQGYGYGILQGLEVAEGEYLGWMHADMQTSPNEIIRIIKDVSKESYNEKVFIKGLRKNRPFLDSFFTFGMSILESIYLQTILYDINAQPTLFHRSLCSKWKNPPFDFSLDLYAYYTAAKLKYNIKRYPVMQNKRIFGQSSWNTGMNARIKLIKRVFFYSKKLKKDLIY